MKADADDDDEEEDDYEDDYNEEDDEEGKQAHPNKLTETAPVVVS